MRLRAILIGLIVVIILGIITPICDLNLIGVLPGASYFPVGAIFLFFFFVFILNTILKVLKIPLSSQELLLIYAMMVVASGIPSFGYALYVIGIIAAPYYFATPENRYAEILYKLIPDWMHPKNPDTVKYFYEGLPQGMKIPWKDWIGPLFLWALLALSIYLVMFCLSVIVRKQWVENEKLVFPLAMVPVDIVKEDGEQGRTIIPSFFKNRLMWLGFLIPVIIYSMRGLHFYFPAVPTFKNDYYIVFMEKPWNVLGRIQIKLAVSILGFAYLVPTYLSFSLWFFYFVYQAQVLVGGILGFPMPMVRGWYTRAFLANQEAGGMIAYVILLSWAMRGELKNMFSKILHRGKTLEERKEGISYLFAFLGLILGFLFICFFAIAAGIPFWAIFLWASIFFITVIVISRAVAESGLFFVQYDSFPLEIVTNFTGSLAMGENGISMLNAINRVFNAEGRVLLMPFFLNNLKMADAGNMKKKTLNISMWLAIVLMIVTSYIVILTLSYKYGAINFTQWWLVTYPKQCTWDATIEYISSPALPSLKDSLIMAIGAGVTIFLFWMRRIFVWWPFHPIGYLVGANLTPYRLWFMTLWGWLAKVLILRIGGIKIYRKLIPVFLGLIIGEFVTVGAWVIVDLFTGARGNFIMWL